MVDKKKLAQYKKYNVFINLIPKNANPKDIHEFLSKHGGEVFSLKIGADENQENRGYGYANFYSL